MTVTVPTMLKLTSDLVVRGLALLGLAAITRAVEHKSTGAGWFPAPITRDGPGWRADVELPRGVTVTDVVERRDRLASGLRRRSMRRRIENSRHGGAVIAAMHEQAGLSWRQIEAATGIPVRTLRRWAEPPPTD